MNEYVTDILLENAKSTLDEKLRSLRDEYRTNGVPTLLTESLNELILFVKLKKPKRILELGTATGCSGIAMLLASPCSTLTTIEKFEKSAEEAKTNFEKFGVYDRVTQLVGDALEKINEVSGEYDFVFLDCANQVSRKFACQHWVFREVLKIAPAEWVAHNVDARCQDDVDTVGFCFVGHAFALQRGGVDVPSGGKSGG